MIEFQVQNVDMPTIDVAKVMRWIGVVAACHGRKVGEIAYRFCDDEGILNTNRQFLSHDYFTDIITFDYSAGNRINGDILISLDTVASNADLIGVPYSRELHRVIIHGILHLCGIDDKGPGEREIMEMHEDRALEIFDAMK